MLVKSTINNKNTQRNRFSLFILAIISVSILAFFLVPSLSKKLNDKNIKSTITQNRKTYEFNESDTYGYWTLKTNWSANDNVTLSKDALTATLTPLNNSYEDNYYTLNVSSTYRAASATAEYFDYLTYTIPFTPVTLKGAKNLYSYAIDRTNNRVLIKKNISGTRVTIGYIKMGQITLESLATGEETFIWNMDASSLYITNYDIIQPDDAINFSFSIEYHIMPSEITPAKNVKSKVNLDFDEGKENFDSNVVYTVANTNVSISDEDDSLQTEAEVYEKWNKEWGQKTNDPKSYYVEYTVSGDIYASQAFNATLIPSIQEGELVAYSDGTNYYLGNLDNYVNDTTTTKPSNDYNVSSISKIGNTMPTSTAFKRSYIVKYPLPNNGETKQTEMSLNINVNGVDLKSANKVVTWTKDFEYIRREATYPEGENNEINQELVDETKGLGALNKIENGEDVTFTWQVEASSHENNINSEQLLYKAFNNWNNTENGTKDYNLSLELSKMTLDESYNTKLNETILTDEYELTSFYPLDDVEYEYYLHELDQAYYLRPTTSLTNTPKIVYIKINNGSWQKIGTYQKDELGNINYLASDNLTASINNVNLNNQINLPKGTTNLKIVYSGKKAAVYLGYNVNIKLIAAKIKSPLSKMPKEEIILKSYSSTNLNEELKDEDVNGTYLTSQETASHLDITSNYKEQIPLENDIKGDIISYTLDAYDEISYTDSSLENAKKLLNNQKEGTYYYLLPIGSKINGSPVVTPYNTSIEATTDVQTLSNWQNTNRDMLIIKINTTAENNYQTVGKYLRSGFKLSFDLLYSQISNRDYGNIITSDAAYLSTNNLFSGYQNSNAAPSELFSNESIKKQFLNLPSEETSSYLFATNEITIDSVSVVMGNAHLSVKGPSDSDYSETTTVKEGGLYTYKLQYSYDDPLVDINNLVIFDSLENAFESNEHWQGQLVDVDLSYLKETLDINAKVYYSNIKDIDFQNSLYNDLTKENVWSLDKPQDASSITAIAIDCGNHEFVGTSKELPMAYVTMRAALNYESFTHDKPVYSYNNDTVKYTNYGMSNPNYSTSEITKVALEKTPLDVNVVTKDNFDSEPLSLGTQDTPTKVPENFGYLVTLTNNDDISSYQDIQVSDLIANGLIIDFDNIKYYLNDEPTTHQINDNQVKYEYQITNNNLTFNIKEIAQNTKINIWIPVSVDIDNLNSQNIIFKNSVSLTKISDIGYSGNTYVNYNRIIIPIITISKQVKTNETGVFTSATNEAIIISRGEKYSYMVKINNNGEIASNSINVVDNVPQGLTIDEETITNEGKYDAESRTITWNIPSLEAMNYLELTYEVTVPSDVTLNTKYTSIAHVKVINPFNAAKYLVDEDTNSVTTVYKTTTDIILNNSVQGPLADLDKKFNYELNFTGQSDADGEYEVVDTNSSKIGSIKIINGVGQYKISLKNLEKITIKNLPGNLKYTINQTVEKGYNVSLLNQELISTANIVSINGTTDDEKIKTYNFINEYHASTTYTPNVKVTYSSDLNDSMFEYTLIEETIDGNYEDVAFNKSDGTVPFNTIYYNDKVGTYTYKISQKEGDQLRIRYDSNIYKIIIKIEDNHDGTLSKKVTCYDKFDKECPSDEIIFNNEYIDGGVLISNVHEGDYINPAKSFSYRLTVNTDSSNDGEYIVTNQAKENLNNMVISNGIGQYDFSLKSDESILVKELPIGSTYTIVQTTDPYYKSRINNQTYTVDEQNLTLTTTGTIVLETTKINFRNFYETKASFTPEAFIELQEKELLNNEFSFIIKDISEQSTNYNETVSNNIDGKITFTSLNFTKPGTYTYEITQIKGNSNHIYYDLQKCILTLILVDNEDGTMSIDYKYKFSTDISKFVNRYSKTPIVPEYTSQQNSKRSSGVSNPNTIDYMLIVSYIAIIATTLLIINCLFKVKKYK